MHASYERGKKKQSKNVMFVFPSVHVCSYELEMGKFCAFKLAAGFAPPRPQVADTSSAPRAVDRIDQTLPPLADPLSTQNSHRNAGPSGARRMPPRGGRGVVGGQGELARNAGATEHKIERAMTTQDASTKSAIHPGNPHSGQREPASWPPRRAALSHDRCRPRRPGWGRRRVRAAIGAARTRARCVGRVGR